MTRPAHGTIVAHRPSLAALLIVVAALSALGATPATANTRKPDVTVRKVVPVSGPVKAGSSLVVVADVRNMGRRPASRVGVVVLLSRDAKRDKADRPVAKSTSIKRLKARKTSRTRIAAAIPATAAAGAYRLLVCATVKGDGKRSNDCRAAALTIVTDGGAGNLPGPRPGTAPGGTSAATPTPTPTASATPSATPTATPTPTPTPDPVTVLEPPALDSDTPVSVYEAASFLFTGSGAPQQGVAPGTISPERIAVLRGRVTDRAGEGIETVKVTVLREGELGRAYTRADGVYDIAVNGGGPVTLVFEKAGYLPLQRTIDPPWRDYTPVEDVSMTQPDPATTAVNPNGGTPFQVVRGSKEEDLDGERRAVLLVPNGVSAKMKMPDGSKPALPGPWTFRITEYTAGPGGKAAMPGELPPATQYTYAVEFSVDQADAAGATGVEFSTPLINYVENFADVPVGNGMPSGAYDRATGRWIAAPDGRVIAITAETGGLAEIDLDGKSGADTAQALHAFGISDDERRVLADLYAPGAQLMRMLVPHFSPWDHNSGMGIPPGARVPRLQDFIWKDPNDPCKNSLFSEIACERQTVIERIPIAGTPYELAYTNDRQPGWKADSKLTLPITGVQVPALVGQIEATVDVAGRRVASGIWCDPTRVGITFQTDCQARPDLVPNLELPIEWDGLDAYGRRVQGRPYATVRLTYYYKGFSYGSPYEAEASFGRAAEGQSFEMRGECRQLPGSNDVILGGNGADRRPPQPPPPDCLLGIEVSARRTLGTLDAQSWLGLGGWTVSPVHALDTVDSTVFRGDGATSRGEVLGPRVTRVGGLAFSNGGAGNFPEAEGRPGNEVSFDYLSDIAVSADGSIFVLHSPCFFGNDGGLRRISPDGTKTTTMAPRSRCYGPPPGDDEEFQADSDDPNRPNFLDGNTYHVAAGPNGEAYVTVVDSNSTGQATSALIVRRVDRDGTVRTVAGVPWSGAFNFNEDGDGGPARNAKLRISNDAPLAVAPDGTIYVVDSQDRIRRIGTDGVIDTYAGGGLDATQDQDLGDGERALNHDFGAITGMTVGFDGSLYVADRDEFRILRIRPDGQLQRVAGIGTNTIGLGGPALQQGIGRPLDVAQNREGELIVRTIVPATANGSPVRLLTINTEGGMTPLAGKIDGEECDESAEFRIPDGRPARDACFFQYSRRRRPRAHRRRRPGDHAVALLDLPRVRPVQGLARLGARRVARTAATSTPSTAPAATRARSTR